MDEQAVIDFNPRARGMIIGMIHGARPDAPALPEEWLTGLRAKDIIRDNLVQILAHA